MLLVTIRGEDVRDCLVGPQTILQAGTGRERRLLLLIANAVPHQVGSAAEERVRRSGMAESSTLDSVRLMMTHGHN